VTVAERFAANLRRARKGAGLSQEALALGASLHRTEVSQLERALRVPRIDTLVKLSATLGVDAADLLQGMTWEQGETRLGHFTD
jgi:transcriptional regulator with XRE-family HTH domain